MELFEKVFREVVEVLIIPVELIGVLIILQAAVVNFIAYIRRKRGVRLALAQSLATALEFKLASEILRTVVAFRVVLVAMFIKMQTKAHIQCSIELIK